MANSISVAVADIETIFSGSASRVSLPLSPVTVTGKALLDELPEAALSSPEEEPPQAVRASSSETSSDTRTAALERGVVRGTGMPLCGGGRHRPLSRRLRRAPCATLTARVGDMT